MKIGQAPTRLGSSTIIKLTPHTGASGHIIVCDQPTDQVKPFPITFSKPGPELGLNIVKGAAGISGRKRQEGRDSIYSQERCHYHFCVSQICLGSACPLTNKNKCQPVLLIILRLFRVPFKGQSLMDERKPQNLMKRLHHSPALSCRLGQSTLFMGADKFIYPNSG